MTSTETVRGKVALMLAHCAGMIDLVALPVWVGTLVGTFKFDSQQAGILASLFLGGAVLASLSLAPVLSRLPARWVTTVGYLVGAASFLVAARNTSFDMLAALHFLAGLSAGAALSVTHGTIALSARPHRLFAVVGVALGVFAILALGATPQVVAQWGGGAMFYGFGGFMLIAAVGCALAFPAPPNRPGQAEDTQLPIPRVAWWGIAGVSTMALVQAMTFSFLQRVGIDRGFDPNLVTTVLVAVGIVNVIPAGLAGALERIWFARTVLLIGPLFQAVLANLMMNASTFAPYAGAASVFTAVMIFTHTFAFGLLARLDASGRALAGTPAMLMVGAALGPALGGTLVKSFGYPSIGVAALALAALAVWCFSHLPKQGAPEGARVGSV